MGRTNKKLPLVALVAATALSIAGNTMALLAVPWFVLETTGSASQTGFATAFFFLPVPVAGIFGGAIVDRLGYKRSSVTADLLSGSTIAMIPLLHVTVGIEYWQLLVLVFVGTLFDSPADTARYSLMPDLADAANVPIERITAIEQGVIHVARLGGAPLAGLLIAVLGAEHVLWFDAATFAVSAGLVAFAVPTAARSGEGAATDYVTDLKEGFAFVVRDRALLAIIVTVGLTNFIGLIVTAVLPTYADQVYDSSLALGLILGLSGGGALVGLTLFGAFGNRLPRFLVFAGGNLVVGLAMWLYPLELPLLILLAGRFVSGVASGPIGPVMGATFFERAPDNMRARVVGMSVAVAWTGTPLGALTGGFLVGAIGLTETLVVAAAAFTLVALASFVNPALRGMSAQPRSEVIRGASEA
jgi:MFS family permease